jgi:hypothetical protein
MVEVLLQPGVLETVLFWLCHGGGERKMLPYQALALRGTCRATRAALEFPGRVKAKSIDWVLADAAAAGDADLCAMCRARGATNWDAMLRNAAAGGHEHICRLAKEWGATDWNGMLYNAASGGHEGICRLAIEWRATDWDGMLRSAAAGGNERLCWLAREWGATN